MYKLFQVSQRPLDGNEKIQWGVEASDEGKRGGEGQGYDGWSSRGRFGSVVGEKGVARTVRGWGSGYELGGRCTADRCQFSRRDKL